MRLSMHSIMRILVVALLAAPFFVEAQLLNPVGTLLEIVPTPLKAQPEQLVDLELKSFSVDLKNSTISWYRNQTLVKQGVGETKFSVTAPKAGGKLTVLAVAESRNGATLRASFILQPEDVTLVWEAETYTPPFYEGKALYTPEAIVKIIALPNFINSNGTKISPKNLIYNWKQDFKAQASASGYGKDFFIFKGNLLQKPTTIHVEVVTVDGTRAGNAVLTVEPVPTKILTYEDSPLYGTLRNRVLSTQSLVKNQEVRVEAVPFSFSVLNPSSGSLTYSWAVNSRGVDTPVPKNILTLRNEKAETGSALVSVSVTHAGNIFQTSGITFPIIFNSKVQSIINSLFNNENAN
jgi:hypothetical protein